jgi:hypothetical protein
MIFRRIPEKINVARVRSAKNLFQVVLTFDELPLASGEWTE